MISRSELIDRIKLNIGALERENQDDFDLVANALSISQDSIELLRSEYGNDKIESWKKDDDPAFDRFGSKLKSCLELQRNYLASILDALMVEGDVISQKVSAYQIELEETLAREGSILKEGAALFEKQDELQEHIKRLAALLKKKATLEDIERKLSEYDVESLSAEVKAKEDALKKMEEEYRPLLKKRQVLEEECAEVQEAMRNLTKEIDQLEGAYGAEAIRLGESISAWIQKIKTRRIAREEKHQKYIADLEKEAEELNKIESQVQEQLKNINEFASKSMTYGDILKTHFQADRSLGDRFSKSMINVKERLTQTGSLIETELKRFDVDLKGLQKSIEDAAAQVKSLSLGG